MATDTPSTLERLLTGWLRDAIRYFEGIDPVLLALVTLAAFALLLLRPIARRFRRTGRQASISGAAPAGTGPSSGSDPSLIDSVEHLSRMRSALRPQPLGPAFFPADVDIIDFDPNGKFRLRLVQPAAGRLILMAFSLPFYLIFPSLLAGLLTGSPELGTYAGLALWVWRNWLGAYLSIDFAKRKFALINPAAASWLSRLPSAELRSVLEDGKWKASVVIEEHEVIVRRTANKEPHSDLDLFVKSLNWHLGKHVQIAEGVYISR